MKMSPELQILEQRPERTELQAAVDGFEKLKFNTDIEIMGQRVENLLCAVKAAIVKECRATMQSQTNVNCFDTEMSGVIVNLVYDIEAEIEKMNSTDAPVESLGYFRNANA